MVWIWFILVEVNPEANGTGLILPPNSNIMPIIVAIHSQSILHGFDPFREQVMVPNWHLHSWPPVEVMEQRKYGEGPECHQGTKWRATSDWCVACKLFAFQTLHIFCKEKTISRICEKQIFTPSSNGILHVSYNTSTRSMCKDASLS